MTLVLGVIGHVDHGKTALVHALTGTQTDRLAEEKARGISIVLGFAHMALPGGTQVDLIDVPGHERFVRTAVSGATGMDAVLLVVDAREGVMPQTREHVFIAALLGISRAIVAVSRIDLASMQLADAGLEATCRLARTNGLEVAASVAVSARTGQGMPALREAIVALADDLRPRADHGAPWLPVDRAFSRPGYGSVVTGTLRHGRLAVGDVVEVSPDGIPARVRGLQVHGARVSSAAPGQRVAVNLRGPEPAKLGRGAALCMPGALSPSAWLSVWLTVVPDAAPLRTSQTMRLLFGTAELDARVRLLDCDSLAAGESGFAQLRCAAPVGIPAREHFILRVASPAATIAGGVVLDPDTLRARRGSAHVLARLAGLAAADPGEVIGAEVAAAGITGVGLDRLARIAAVSPAQATALLRPEDTTRLRGGTVVSVPALHALAAILPRVLAAHRSGVAPATLQALVPRAGPAVLDEAMTRLITAGVLVREGAALRLVRPDQDRAAANLAATIAQTLRDAGLCPPDLAELAPDAPRRHALTALVRAGVAIRAPDAVQKRVILFHADAIKAARGQLAALLPAEGLLVGEVGAALGISRKFCVPLLEHLDRAGFTRRLGERRVLANTG